MERRKTYTKQDVLDMARRCSNWGRWGPQDELGVLNFVTPADIVNAAQLVRRGKVFALGLAAFGALFVMRRRRAAHLAV